jgi:hypothetical protein
MNAYLIAEQLDSRCKTLSRKEKKALAREEKLCRRSLVRFAGQHKIASIAQIVAHVRTANSWALRRPARVPRSLRFTLGTRTGGAFRAYKQEAHNRAVRLSCAVCGNVMQGWVR